ncbi:MAG: hypothetical protein FJ399_23255 [Verrucomicrobia bacterium]|nr:hypothetical protein [Verrucomicrobiota bacterium]
MADYQLTALRRYANTLIATVQAAYSTETVEVHASLDGEAIVTPGRVTVGAITLRHDSSLGRWALLGPISVWPSDALWDVLVDLVGVEPGPMAPKCVVHRYTHMVALTPSAWECPTCKAEAQAVAS